jgi:aminoglycoside phosphotransferase (APT) family kinase protein
MTAPLSRLRSALADRYAIERELGRGGMATVYLARDLRHQRLVALKVLDPELAALLGAERFLSEIRTTASLQHPHILPLFESGRAEGQLYYVMPYVDGETLRARLERERQLPVEDAVRLAREVADALQYAHDHRIIPSRHQAGECPAARRPRPRRRLRHRARGAAGRRRADDANRFVIRHTAVHVPRTGHR